MGSLRKLTLRIRSLFRRGVVDGELNSELDFHVEMQARQNMARGMDPEEARYAALRAFGGVPQIEEECRDARGTRLIEAFFSDVRQGIRLLAKTPGFTITAIATLALGIGVNTAIFTVVNAALLRPLPYADPDRLVQIWETLPGKGALIPAAPANFYDWRQRVRTMSGVTAYSDGPYDLTGDREPERMTGIAVPANFFDVLGVRPVSGRSFQTGEDDYRAELVVMLSDGAWRQRFGADAGVLGRKITLDGSTRTIIGILPPSFQLAEVVVPLVLKSGARADRYGHWLPVIGRLRPGATLARAQSEMDAVARGLQKQFPDSNTGWGIHLVPLPEQIAGPVRQALLLLSGAVGFVLLIACANVSNLLLARSVPRQREMAIRTTLGATHGRLLRQLLAESLLLSAAGTLIGLFTARWGLTLLLQAIPPDLLASLPYFKDLRLDATVLVFAITVCVLTALICGIAPALQASRRDPQPLLQVVGRNNTAGLAGQRFRSVLVATEVALAIVLLVGSGLALRSLQQVLQVQPGLNPNHVLTLRISLQPGDFKNRPELVSFQHELLRGIRALPQVQESATVVVLPLSGSSYMSTFSIVGQQVPAWKGPSGDYLTISPDYFKAVGAPLISGRFFDDRDSQDGRRVAIINQTLARQFFPNEDPIGKKVVVWRSSEQPREIVGVAGDIHNTGLEFPVRAAVYLPFAQDPQLAMNLVVRTVSNPVAVAADVRNVIRSLTRSAPVFDVRTMDEVIARSPTLVLRRVPSLLMAILALAALLLSAVGIAGVMSSVVGQRTQEIGIRMALGASRSMVLGLVLGQSFKMVAAGLVVGLGLSLVLTRLMETWLFGVSRMDALTYSAMTLTLILVALLACYLPARRATQVDPTVALRYE